MSERAIREIDRSLSIDARKLRSIAVSVAVRTSGSILAGNARVAKPKV